MTSLTCLHQNHTDRFVGLFLWQRDFISDDVGSTELIIKTLHEVSSHSESEPSADSRLFTSVKKFCWFSYNCSDFNSFSFRGETQAELCSEPVQKFLHDYLKTLIKQSFSSDFQLRILVLVLAHDMFLCSLYRWWIIKWIIKMNVNFPVLLH